MLEWQLHSVLSMSRKQHGGQNIPSRVILIKVYEQNGSVVSPENLEIFFFFAFLRSSASFIMLVFVLNRKLIASSLARRE